MTMQFPGRPPSRRDAIRAAGAVAAGSWLTSVTDHTAAASARQGRIRQSIVHWCFAQHWDIERTCQIAKQLGCESVELVPPQHWPLLKRYGLVCAMCPLDVPAPAFQRGLNNPRYQAQTLAAIRRAIDACAEFGFPNVIAFTGFKYRDADDPQSGEIPKQEGADQCVAALRRVIGHAESKGVNICLEHLNSRDDSDPRKGHPGYQGDHVDDCLEIVRRVGSPRMKLLYDIYHVQVMDGDHIRRLREYGDLVGHIHTAGNPGRGELDGEQEILYPPILRCLLENGFTGFVGQEFLPTGEPLAALQRAVRLCDVH